ncbi:MAG TPA: DNRLRE domain-containing protein, partial [Actinomycetota bacterium]
MIGRRAALRLGGLGALALFTALVAIPANATAFTFNPVADSYVNSASPSTNYGGSTRLRVDASPKIRSFLRFSVQGISGSVSKATLRLYAVDGSSDGYKVRSVSDTTWGETGITYNNAPAFSSPVLGKSGSIRG